jgi:hypothetical protein
MRISDPVLPPHLAVVAHILMGGVLAVLEALPRAGRRGLAACGGEGGEGRE